MDSSQRIATLDATFFKLTTMTMELLIDDIKLRFSMLKG